MNPNYVTIIKYDIDKLFVASFIKLVEDISWLSPIVLVLNKNKKLRICVDFKVLNVVIKKDPYMLPFTNEIINILPEHEVYTLLYGLLGYHQISIALEDQYSITFLIDWGLLYGL